MRSSSEHHNNGGGGGVGGGAANNGNGGTAAANFGVGGVGSTARDPSTLLARGYTARFLTTGLPGMAALSAEERDKDLRHFEAYRQAVISYRQQYYMAVNRSLPGVGIGGGVGAVGAAATGDPKSNKAVAAAGQHHHHQHPLTLSSLPVRIDVEEEKRLAMLRKKICLAEYHRENAEQQYVALRAHYVQVSRKLKERQNMEKDENNAMIKFLQECVEQRAAAVGLLRARLQMTRDVLSALKQRNHVLASAPPGVGGTAAAIPAAAPSSSAVDTEAPPADANKAGSEAPDAAKSEGPTGSGADGDTAMPDAEAEGGAADRSPSSPTGDELEDIWNKVVDESIALATNHKSSAKKQQKKMEVACTKLPSTPHGVPLLLSALSSAPEKTLAYGVGGHRFFGAKDDSMCWLVSDMSPEEDNDDEQDVDALAEEAAFLQEELDKERMQNHITSQKIADARHKNDEWIAMICLLRQETEAVLFRHNIVLDSEIATKSAEKIHERQEQEKLQQEKEVAATLMAQAGGAGPAVSSGEVGGAGVPQALPEGGKVALEDHANDGDDEGTSGGEDESAAAVGAGKSGDAQQQEGANSNKRSLVDAGVGSGQDAPTPGGSEYGGYNKRRRRD